MEDRLLGRGGGSEDMDDELAIRYGDGQDRQGLEKEWMGSSIEEPEGSAEGYGVNGIRRNPRHTGFIKSVFTKKALISSISVVLTWCLLGLLLRDTSHSQVASRHGKGRPIKFDEIFNGTFTPRDRGLKWVESPQDGYYTYQEQNQTVLLQHANASTPRVLFGYGEPNYSDGRDISWASYVVSPSLTQILLKTDLVKKWRHSQKAHYFIYDTPTKRTWPLVDLPDEPQASYACWAPTGTHLAYVSGNDIYVTQSDAQETRRVTEDGSETMMNGVPDWVYEEEIYEDDHTLWWSPDGKSLAFLKTDDQYVHQFTVPKYFQQRQSDALLYPDNLTFRYPKAGTPNPRVTVNVYHLDKTQGPSALQVSGDFADDDRLVTEVQWMGSDQLMVRSSDRGSNSLKYVLYDVNTLEGRIVRESSSRDSRDDKGWYDASQRMAYIPSTEDGTEAGYIDIVYHNDCRHLAFFSPLDNPKGEMVTTGDWEVVGGVKGYDQQSKMIYYLSTEASPTERHLYSVHLGTKRKSAVTLVAQPAWYDASFSPAGAHYILDNQGPGVPYQKIVGVHNHGEMVTFENNTALVEILASKRLPSINYGTVRVKDQDLEYMEILPRNADLSGKVKYPVIFKVYNGPDSQSVQKKFRLHWDALLAAEEKVIVVVVDGRGTGFKGRKFRNLVYRHLGHLEAEDQIAAAQIWSEKSYVDASRIGIWGWSYGGYIVSKVVEADSGVFSMAIAVAPVTDWRFYNSIYTERYMGSPSDNSEGYTTSAVNRMDGFQKTSFMLIHGSGDDNVHLQHSANLIDKLTMSHVHHYVFRLFVDSDHSISYRGASVEIYYAMRDFIRQTYFPTRHYTN